MRIYYKILIISALVVSTLSCSTNNKLFDSQGIVTPVSEKSFYPDGSLIYGLPLTVVDVEIVAEKTFEKPGPYSKFAGDLLGLNEVIKTEKESWKIKWINVGTHQELDPDQLYIIEAHNLYYSNVLALKSSGLILDINGNHFDGSKGFTSEGVAEIGRISESDLGSDEYFSDRKDTLFKVINVDTAFIRIPYLVEKKQKLTQDQLAVKAATRLMELRDGKHLILTGETNVFPQNDAAINEMNRLEKQYTELFTGKIFREQHILRYQVIPVKDASGRSVTICRFSEAAGPLPVTEKSGTPVTVEFVSQFKTKGVNLIKSDSKQESSGKTAGLLYRMPDVVTIKISSGNESLTTSRRLLYQFGEIVRLPSNFIITK